MVKKKVLERGFGFIQGEDGKDYFFHCTDLETGFTFETLKEGGEVGFLVKKAPEFDRAGAAQSVHPDTDAIPALLPDEEYEES